MSTDYKFKRSFYYDVEKAIQESSVTFILGTRRCGKTVCMEQLRDTATESGNFEEVVYYDMKHKGLSPLDKSLFLKRVLKAIEEDRKSLFLIDEATYMTAPDDGIEEVRQAFSVCDNHNTRVVFTGSQSKALSDWGHNCFAGDAIYVHADFLSYPEWLAYQELSEVSEETYQRFLVSTREFYRNFRSTKEYLDGCLKETVQSYKNSMSWNPKHPYDDIDTEMLMDVLYASLIMLHNNPNYLSFKNPDALYHKMLNFYAEEILFVGEENLKRQIAELLAERYRSFERMNPSHLLRSILFLKECGLITVLQITDNLNSDPYFTSHLEHLTNYQIMHDLSICIKYPMFHIDIVKSLLGSHMPEKIPPKLLGSIVECHVRGLLPEIGSIEFQHLYTDEDGNSKIAEIDYVNSSKNLAVEITISNKRIKNTNFNFLPDSYRKILLSKTWTDTRDNIERVPYYRFIYDNSIGKELSFPYTGIPFDKWLDANFVITPTTYGNLS